MKKMQNETDKTEECRHGGDIYHHEVRCDYSVNINPLGIHPQIMETMQKSISDSVHYPDYRCEQLTQALAHKTGLVKAQILCGNGASDLFMGIVHALHPKKAFVFAPSFYGYTYALQAVDCKIHYEQLSEKHQFQITEESLESLKEDTDILFLCVPNNPTGTLPKKEQIIHILDRCQRQNIVVVYDQCFLEFTDQYEELRGEQFLAQYPNLIVVNAFTKTYAIPGIRLGYACSSEKMIKKIAGQLAEWRVSTMAMAAGVSALWVEENTTYLQDTRALLEKERTYLEGQLDVLQIKHFDTEADYILIKSELPLYDKLLEKGFLIRHCNNYVGLTEDYYRIAIKQHEENEQLMQALKEIVFEISKG